MADTRSKVSRRLRTTALVASTAGALLLGVAPKAAAQRLLVPHDRPRALVALVDVQAGALVDNAWLDVGATAIPPPSPGAIRVAERVGDEVWVGAAVWVYRYDAVTRTFINSFFVDAPIRSIECQTRQVIVTTSDDLQSFDFDGTPRHRYPIYGAGDTLELRDSMLVAIKDESRIDRYALDGTRLGTFAGPSIPTALGVLSKPQQLALRADGNVLVCGDVRVYEFTADGEFVGEYDVGPFEGGVAETIQGRLVVPLANGLALHDAATRATTRVGGLVFGQGRTARLFDRGPDPELEPDGSSSDVTCPGGVNSSGRVARVGVLGSANVADRIFSVFGDRLPPGAPAIVALAPSARRTVLEGGTLCLDPDSTTFVPQTVAADGNGTFLLPLVRGQQAIALFPPGTTWHVQLLVRDGPSLVLSDAARVTFAE